MAHITDDRKRALRMVGKATKAFTDRGVAAGADRSTFIAKAVVGALASNTAAAATAGKSAVATIDAYVAGTHAVSESELRAAVLILGAVDVVKAVKTAGATAGQRNEADRLLKLASGAHDPQLAAGYRQLAERELDKLPSSAATLRARAQALRLTAKSAGTPALFSELTTAAELLEQHAERIAPVDDGTATDQGVLQEVITAVRRLIREVEAVLVETANESGIPIEPVLDADSATKSASADLARGPLDTIRGLRTDHAAVKAKVAWLGEQPLPAGPVRMRPASAHAAAAELDSRLSKAARFEQLARSVTDPALAAGYRQLAAAETAAADRARTEGDR